MDSSTQQHNVCLSAAVADLSQIGMTFPEFVPDCGSYDCAYCMAIRKSSPKVESEAQEQARLTHFEIARAMTNSGSIGEDDDTPPVLSSGADSLSNAPQCPEKTLEELCGLKNLRGATKDRRNNVERC